MTGPLNILAASDSDLVQIVVVLALLALSGLGSLIKKVQEKKKAQEMERQAEQERLRQSRPRASAPPPPPRVVLPARVTRRLPARRSPPAPEPAAVRVEEGLARQRRRMDQTEQLRQQRMATAAPAEADTTAIESRLIHIARAASHVEDGRAAPSVVVNLRAPADARLAVVYHEILSPPKALRRDRETWEL